MSLTATELNYLIWRYLQEGGLEVSAYALQDETKINEYDDRYGDRIPLGCLVDLVQKGILYYKVNDMIQKGGEIASEDIINMNFNLLNSISQSSDGVEERRIEPTSAIANNTSQPVPLIAKNGRMEDDNDFTVVLKNSFVFPASLASSWHPQQPNMLAWGQRDSTSIICSLTWDDSSKALIPQSQPLPHPPSCKETVSISWSPKGNTLMTASENGELRLWDSNGSIRFIMALHRSPVLTIRWSPNSAYLLTLDITNKAVVWDSQTGQSIQHIADLSTDNTDKCLGTDACWIDDTKFVLPGLDYSLYVYQLGDSQPIGVLAGHTDTVSLIMYNSELRLLCSASDDQTVRIWKGNSINSLQVLTGHSQPLTYVSWCKLEDGNWCVVTCSLDGSLKIWDFFRNKVLDSRIVDNGSPILVASLSPDSTKLATGDSDGNIMFWAITATRKFKQLSYYQPGEVENSNFVSTIDWNSTSTQISVGYSGTSSCVVKIV
ncbi:hypothetical protein KL905_002707 [Ogataea polymorpha]|uniref:SIR4-interacting protein SIF2 n=1 Tax=Ogataea polymorpha TaxID=460523 RepID=A0A1B7SP22_9ASCO|nr:uncharacterized protein OGAPODRAFT_96360 [Ogataea polymorpha]KAG7880734.1 hypothetical protein KL937_002296 [Ogataea polymorpha]KAG7894435.1 hypothetical protein KL908_001807 [Ogataea polymorpha]KAG7906811.1 hypothetical protein KL907_002451 [Ogataea polymorpha]KAG7917759.1 hypothetical protein KL927_002502 [Ogataea polymorpha]KAG7921942.1 hypothetical protein KL905_002707 [Ogataea polymorpha]